MLIRQHQGCFQLPLRFIPVAMKLITMVTWRAADTVAAQGFDECREFCSPQKGERQVDGEGCY